MGYDYRAYNIRVIGHEADGYGYAAKVNPLAASLARQEHEKGSGGP